MRHYHGTPLGGTRDSVARFMAQGNRSFLVPFNRPEDMPIVSESSRGFVLDNGAFSAWKKGEPITDWKPYYDWCKELHQNPRFDFAVIPDVIDGSEEENRELFSKWFKGCRLPAHYGWVKGSPVWHMHESFDQLRYFMQHSEIISIGSSGQYSKPGTRAWHQRMGEAMQVLCDSNGRPLRKIHGLRMLSPRIVERYPFHSADSTNVAQNSQLLTRFGMYAPPTQSQRREVLASRIEATQSPSAYKATRQPTLFNLSEKPEVSNG